MPHQGQTFPNGPTSSQTWLLTPVPPPPPLSQMSRCKTARSSGFFFVLILLRVTPLWLLFPFSSLLQAGWALTLALAYRHGEVSTPGSAAHSLASHNPTTPPCCLPGTKTQREPHRFLLCPLTQSSLSIFPNPCLRRHLCQEPVPPRGSLATCPTLGPPARSMVSASNPCHVCACLLPPAPAGTSLQATVLGPRGPLTGLPRFLVPSSQCSCL